VRRPYREISLVFLAFGAMAFIGYIFMVNIVGEHLERESKNTLEHLKIRFDADFQELETMVFLISETIGNMLQDGYDSDAVAKYMKGISGRVLEDKTRARGFVTVFGMFEIFGGMGYNAAWKDAKMQPAPPGYVPQERPWFKIAQEASGGVVITDPYKNHELWTDEMIITIARCLYDEAGNKLATVCVDVLLNRLQIFSNEMFNSYGILLDKNFNIIAHPIPNFIGKALREIGGDSALFANDLLQKGVCDYMLNFNGERFLIYSQRLENGWVVCAATSYDSHYAVTKSIRRFLAAIGFGLALLSSLLLIQIHAGRVKAEGHMRIMFDSMPLSCLLWDKNFNPLDCNEESALLFGFSNKKQYIENYNLLSPQYQPCGAGSMELRKKYLAEALEKGAVRFEWLHQTMDGNPIPCEISLMCSRYNNNDFILSYIRDLRKEKEVLKAINSEKEKNEAVAHWYESILNAVPLPVIVTDNDMNVKFANAINLAVFDMTVDDVYGKHCSIFNTEVCNTENCSIVRVKRGENETYFSHNGVSLKISSNVLRDIDGEIVGFVEVAQDVTEVETLAKKQGEMEEAEKSAGNLSNILSELDAMIYVTDPNTSEILFINDNKKRHFGIKGDPLGHLCYNVLREGVDKRCDFCPCTKLNRHPDMVIVWEERNKVTDKHYRNSSRYINWPDGRLVHLQHSVDITDRRNMELELIAAKESAERNAHSKSIFLASMSHEIRTPMNAILGMAEIQMQNRALPPDALEAMNLIYDSGNLLINIINDILDFSKIEADRLKIIPVKYDIPSLINDTVQLALLRYESKPIQFELQLDEATPLDLFGDELRIKQVLSNLLSNAFKYTDSGTVNLFIGFERLEPKTDDFTLILRVSDTGQGMTEDQIGRLFDEYSRFNLVTNRSIGGTGLGMSITKRLLDIMTGEIFVESEPGKGSVFTVRLPQKQIGEALCGAQVSENLRQLRFQRKSETKNVRIVREYMPYGKVLVVDDVVSNLYVARGLLLPYGLTVETAGSGFEAIELIKSGRHYDIIFMDHMMPRMDGIEAVKIIRELGYGDPVVALTANAILGQAEMFMANGFNGFISKPIDTREFNTILNRMIRDKQPPEVIEAARRKRANEEAASVSKPTINHEIAAAFIYDAEKTIAIMEEICVKGGSIADIRLYTTTVHGIKSALANIGETELSGFAYKLEKAGRRQDENTILCETPEFITALRLIIDNRKPKEEFEAAAVSEYDTVYLREKLLEIKNSCRAFNKKGAKAVLNELRQKTFPYHINKALVEIAEHLLNGLYEDIEGVIENIYENAS
jgi:signal transduction histidine kinase/DNA-binding NarL/FixJ family response regulator